MVEHLLAKEKVAGSNPVFRSKTQKAMMKPGDKLLASRIKLAGLAIAQPVCVLDDDDDRRR